MTDYAPAAPQREQLLGRGGWSLSHAKVLASAFLELEGMVLVDANGDGVERCVDYWSLDDGKRWDVSASDFDVPARSLTASDGMVRAWGRGEPGGHVKLVVGSLVLRVAVENSGWWALLARFDGNDIRSQSVPAVGTDA